MLDPSMKAIHQPSDKPGGTVDGLRPARGLILGVAIGGVLWVLVIVAGLIYWFHRG